MSTWATRLSASWIIRELGTGRVILETFNWRVLEALNTARYEAVPSYDHLVALNRQLATERTP